MYGRLFESVFEGSMIGSGARVFAVWAYVVAKQRGGTVELHPTFLSAILGEPPESIEAAIEHLCAPDPKSRNDAEQGRRLVHVNAYMYNVVSAEIYAKIKTEEDRRRYNREKQRESRARRSVNADPAPPALTDADATSVNADPASGSDLDLRSGSDAREDPGRATMCPADLYRQADANGTLSAIAEKLSVPLESVRHEARQFEAYWTIGGGAGQRRTAWMGKLRQRIVEQHGKNELKPIGAVEHEQPRRAPKRLRSLADGTLRKPPERPPMISPMEAEELQRRIDSAMRGGV